jgi:hypothetical protein
MAQGSNLHPLRHVIPHPGRTDDGEAQLGALGLQEGELLKCSRCSSLDTSHRCSAATTTSDKPTGILLNHHPSPACLRKLTLKEGNLLNKVFNIFADEG